MYPKIDRSVLSLRVCKVWLRDLERKKLKPRFLIIDKVQKSESEDVVEWYRWLCKTWGFELFENVFFNQRYIKKKFMLDLAQQLKFAKEDLKITHKIENDKILFLLLNDLIDNSGISRTLDEVTLIIILTFIFGQNVQKLEDSLMIELNNKRRSLQKYFGPVYGKRFHQFIEYFINKYSKKDKVLAPAFTHIEFRQPELDSYLSKVANYFGYINRLSFESSSSFHLKYHVSFVKWNMMKSKGIVSSSDKVLIKCMYYSDSHVHRILDDEIIKFLLDFDHLNIIQPHMKNQQHF